MTTPPLATVIVDAPASACDAALRILADDSEIVVAGIFESSRDGAGEACARAPQLLLIGANTRGTDWRDVVRDLAKRGCRPQLIVLSADAAAAVDAYAVGAIDFLLVPIDRDRLTRAVARAKARVAAGNRVESTVETRHSEGSDPSLGRLVLRNDEGTVIVLAMEDIEYCQAADNKVRIQASGTSHETQCRLGELERRLDPHRFVRIHRSALINVERLAEFLPGVHGDCQLLMDGGDSLTLSRRYRKRLVALLRNRHSLTEDQFR